MIVQPMNNFDEMIGKYREQLLRSIPRILSQIDRDPDSPTYGSFDRDFWHYKMRDFSSIVLQQGMLVLDVLHDFDHPDNPLYRHPLAIQLIDASLGFWASQQLASGSFNEYYPFEEGYPPTAFSLYAVGLVFRKRGYPRPDGKLKTAIRKACEWLLDHPEHQAFNQESAGLAGLAMAARIPGVTVDAGRLEQRLATFFAGQSPEGWFPEYGGPDLGYLSVTLDCLCDYHETTGDPRATAAMERAVEFISHFIPVAGNTPVMINARNTDYIVPYGLVRLAVSNPMAAGIVRRVFGTAASPLHFLAATDDRYLCHYVYQSCFRALHHLPEMTGDETSLPCNTGGGFFFKESGIYVRHQPARCSIFVAGKKGGVLYLYDSAGHADVDYGWRWKRSGGAVAVTHWQGGSMVSSHTADRDIDMLVVEGRMSVHRRYVPSPLRHLLLRLTAFVTGNRLVHRLKHAMIFNSPDAGVGYRREISVEADRLVVTDRFDAAGSDDFQPVAAPHYSLRHVASAGSFSAEELLRVSEARAVPGKDGEIAFEKQLLFEMIPCE